ncbi:thioesterase family protein [Gordonia amarae]|uniref:NERD domain-containing protein n=2 Tax=Gordonia amarae TaxID=36821 RepID=G7GR54_9ACTN|nr:thioesterase family protein [Gordonia amarae]GAB06079.1 hypothetical protein GOAMR_46_01770 [Gordonia amarae NBRC 15530]MCS3877500.1 acyl-coenzyme A thioesterase PaaI-like protein [Gordonia amarae]QHN16234.1 thioesterase family protein [Gordonia amarae]QHN20803.1 thioesterase family protein [Gordonia amarae]QHN29654.1 thioesterase family protein [Gordonia amarae]
MSELLAAVRTLSPAPGAGAEGVLSYTATVDPAFTIGPKVHGGTLQMVAVAAARQAFAELAPMAGGLGPVAIASDYLSAPNPGVVDVEVSVRKHGRTVAVLTVDIAQGGRTMVASTVTLAYGGEGEPVHRAPHGLDTVPVAPPADGVSVDDSPMCDIVHFGPALDMMLDPKTFHVMRGETGPSRIVGWARPKGSEPDLDFAVLVADASPPVVMNLGMFGWAPTVQLTTYLRRDPAPGWLRFENSSVQVGPGMFEADHLVVDSTGAVVTQSRQLALLPK